MRDRYAETLGGDLSRHETLEDAIARVKSVYPQAYAEGSTGFERTFWVSGEEDIVAHAWMSGKGRGVWHLRLKLSCLLAKKLSV
jgi:hypothetical protein